MLQFYFLSIVMNLLAGYLLFFGDEKGPLEFKNTFPLNAETFRLSVGIISMITGLLKLLSPVEGDLLIIGDIVPAASGLLCGFALVFEYYRNRSTINEQQPEKLENFLSRNRKILGAAALIAAILHFFAPRVLLL